MQSKYHATKTMVDGIVFDSKKEAKRYEALKMMERSGLIADLQRQVKFVLIPAQREPSTYGKRGGEIKGKVIEKECAYIADFVYLDVYGHLVVEDVKGIRTDAYKIKRKLMLSVHGIQIKEV